MTRSSNPKATKNALQKGLGLAVASAIVTVLSASDAASQNTPEKSPKQLNDPLPPQVMPRDDAPPNAVPPRGTPEGMGNETHFTKTPGDDDASDGVDEPGRDPVPGLPRPPAGTEGHKDH